MTDNDERAARVFRGSGDRIGSWRTVILGHRFERAQKISAGCRDFPALVIAKHITAAKNIDGWSPSGKAL